MDISDTTPDNGAVGIALEATVSIVFDEAADPDSIIGSGNVVVVTSANKVFTEGPDSARLDDLTDDLLDSDNFSGFIDGVFTTADNLTFVFTPDVPLLPDRLYRVIIGTDVLSKTINAIVPDGGNTSTGSFLTKGPYTSNVADTYTITVDDGGTLGVATFHYTPTSTGLDSATLTTDRSVELQDGILLNFKSGTFVAGDIWTFTVVEGTALDDITEFSFTTGSFTHTEVSEATPSFQIDQREVEGIRRIDQIPSVDSGTFAVSKIVPPLGASNVSLSSNKIVITFSKDIDAASVAGAVIDVIMENLPMDETQQVSTKLKVDAAVSGKVLTLTFSG